MTPLPSPTSFLGDWISARRAGASWVGEAHFDGVIVVTLWDRTDVAKLLPRAWTTAPNVSETQHRHPVVVALGRQRSAAVLFGGITLPSDADYGEAMIAVPFVRRRDAGGHLHVFVPRMYTADRRATWSGNAFYGFGKRMAAFERLGGNLTVVDERTGLLLHAVVDPRGPWAFDGDSRSISPVPFLRDAFRLPVVGLRHDGSEIVSYFAWSFESASLRPVDAVVTLDAALVDGLEPRALRTADGGAVEVRGMRWRLSWPAPRRR